MSVSITIDHAEKRYGQNTVIPDLSLKIKNGEFFTLLGPSGCGKTTLLRMIAGFNTIEGGSFYFDDVKINDADPGKRNIGMVFQNYAIFPHMSVRQNVAFGLKNRHVPRDEIARATQEFLRLVKIDQYADRMPDMLSGGQQQRVALARALIIKPDVLLMDEPLSNLDAKLRLEMRTVIKEIQNDVGITTVYVTHDQEEAMAISDRIAVMHNGVIQHIGTPRNIYQRPSNLFVATFIGRSNVLKGRLEPDGGACRLIFEDGYQLTLDNVREECRVSQPVLISVRPEEFLLDETGRRREGVKAYIRDSVFLGLNTHYFLRDDRDNRIETIQESTIGAVPSRDTEVYLGVNAAKINVFNIEGTENLLEGVRNDLQAQREG